MPQKDRQAYNEYMREYMLKRYHHRREIAIEQLGGQCVSCGCSDSEALEFDHVDANEKRFCIAKRLAGVSEVKLQEELSRCQLLCGQCHGTKTKKHGEIGLKGENNPAAKLTRKAVLSARKAWVPGSFTFGAAALARKHGVSDTTMSLVLKRRTWKHV